MGTAVEEALDVSGIRHVTADDLAAARSIGGTIKAVVSAERDATGVRAFVGPAFLPSTEPLASLGGALNGIRLDGRHVSNLFFSGPGAGPDVTAATLLDDAVQAASYRTEDVTSGRAGSSRPVFPSSPATPWFLRVTFPGVLPGAAAIAGLVAAAGLPVERVADHATGDSRWLFIGPQGASRRRRRDRKTGQHPSHRGGRVSPPVIGGSDNALRHSSHSFRAAERSGNRRPGRADLSDLDLRAGESGRQSGLRLFAHQQSDAPAARDRSSPSSKASRTARSSHPGLAAEHAVLHAYLRPHDEIIVPLDVYGGTFRLLNRVFAGFDLTVTPVDTANLDAVRAAISARTRLVWLETPTNPRLIVSDIAGDRRTSRIAMAPWSSSTTRSRRRSFSSRSRSAPTSSFTASRSTWPDIPI